MYLPLSSQTPSKLFSPSVLFLSYNQFLFPFTAYSAHPLPLSITLLTPPLCLFSYPSHSVSVCLILCPSPRSLPDSFFHLLVSCFYEAWVLADNTNSLFSSCALSHSAAHLASIISFCLFILPRFPNSVYSSLLHFSFPSLLFFYSQHVSHCIFSFISFTGLITYFISTHIYYPCTL